MKIKIERRWSSETRLEGEAESFKEFVVKNKSDLRGSNLRGSNLRGSDLSDSNLSDSNLSGSNLSGSNLSDSNLSGSNLSGSNLSDSNLRWVKIKASQKDDLLKALRIEVIED